MIKNKPSLHEAASASWTIRETARLECCSEKTIRRAIKAGLLEAYRTGPGGRLLRVTPAAHAAYRRAQRA